MSERLHRLPDKALTAPGVLQLRMKRFDAAFSQGWYGGARRGAVLPIAALLALLSVAHAEIADIRWSADGRFEHTGPIAAGKFFELCGRLPTGLAVRWDFKADTSVDFNVHYHVGKDVVFPFKLSASTTAADTLHTKIEQDYCWMWTNKSAAAATLSVRLRR